MRKKECNQNYAWVVLATLFFAQATLSLGAYAWGPLGPYLINTLSLSSVQLGALTLTLYLFSVICSIPSGIKDYLDFKAVHAGSFLTITMISGGAARILRGFISDRLFDGQRLPVMKIICFLASISSLAVVLWTFGIETFLFIPVVVVFLVFPILVLLFLQGTIFHSFLLL